MLKTTGRDRRSLTDTFCVFLGEDGRTALRDGHKVMLNRLDRVRLT